MLSARALPAAPRHATPRHAHSCTQRLAWPKHAVAEGAEASTRAAQRGAGVEWARVTEEGGACSSGVSDGRGVWLDEWSVCTATVV